MNEIATAIKDYIEGEIYNSVDWNNASVSIREGEKDYLATISINSDVGNAVITYLFQDAKDSTYEMEPVEDYPVFSAIISMDECEVSGFYIDVESDYYLDEFRKYQRLCESVAGILGSINTYYDGRRTYF